MVDMKRYTAAALGALMLAAAPMAANALTVTITSSLGGTTTLVDGGAGDLDGAVDGVITGGGQSVGGFSLRNISASASDAINKSELTQTSLDASGGGAGETLSVVTMASFSGGARAPLASVLSYSLGGSELGGTLSGFGAAGGGATGTLSFDPAVDGFDSFSGDESGFAVLSSPFTMTSDVTIGEVASGRTTSFTSTVTAAIPVPAAGIMLLTALGGLGGAAGLRRKRKA